MGFPPAMGEPQQVWPFAQQMTTPLPPGQQLPPLPPSSPPLPPSSPPVLPASGPGSQTEQMQVAHAWGTWTAWHSGGQSSPCPGQTNCWQMPPTHWSNGEQSSSELQVEQLPPQSGTQGPASSVEYVVLKQLTAEKSQ
jgi:hypothetical protein